MSTFTLTEMVNVFYQRFSAAKVSIPENDIDFQFRACIDYTKGLILSNAFKGRDLPYTLEIYMRDTPDVNPVYLGLENVGETPRFTEWAFEYAKEQIDETGTAKIVTVSDVMDDVWKLYENGFEPGLETDWRGLDYFYKAAKRQLCVVTGLAGTGKSTWLDNYLIQLAARHNWKFCFYSPENYPVAYHIERLLAIHTGKPFSKGKTERMTETEMTDASAWVDSHFTFISSDDNATIDQILNLYRQAIDKHGVNGCILDPWNTIEHRRARDQTETDYICECLTKCLGFTRRRNVSIWIVAHPAKMRRGEDQKIPPPSPYDISGSAHFANRPDVSITVHRTGEDTAKVIINKVRFRQYGHNGEAFFKFDRITGRYAENTGGV